MKVYAVNPGTVKHHSRDYFYSVDMLTDQGEITRNYSDFFSSASAAKQAMREKVRTLRRQHGLELPL